MTDLDQAITRLWELSDRGEWTPYVHGVVSGILTLASDVPETTLQDVVGLLIDAVNMDYRRAGFTPPVAGGVE